MQDFPLQEEPPASQLSLQKAGRRIDPERPHTVELPLGRDDLVAEVEVEVRVVLREEEPRIEDLVGGAAAAPGPGDLHDGLWGDHPHEPARVVEAPCGEAQRHSRQRGIGAGLLRERRDRERRPLSVLPCTSCRAL